MAISCNGVPAQEWPTPPPFAPLETPPAVLVITGRHLSGINDDYLPDPEIAGRIERGIAALYGHALHGGPAVSFRDAGMFSWQPQQRESERPAEDGALVVLVGCSDRYEYAKNDGRLRVKLGPVVEYPDLAHLLTALAA